MGLFGPARHWFRWAPSCVIPCSYYYTVRSQNPYVVGLRFTLAERSEVKLAIYDLRGERVRELLPGATIVVSTA
jgi:hypothetical protein